MAKDQRPLNLFLQALPAADFEALRSHLQTVELTRESVLIDAGDAPTQIYLPHSGVISMVVSLSEGQAVEVAMVGRDGVVGALEALGDGIAPTDAVVLCPGTASVLHVATLKAIAAQSATLRSLLMRHGQALLAQAQQSVACNAAHSVEERLARWLLRARDLWDGESLPLTQELLARMIGVQRNAVSIVAHALQQAGVLSYSRGKIEITDLKALRGTACECCQTFRAMQMQLLG